MRCVDAPAPTVVECGFYGCTTPARGAYCTEKHRDWDRLRAQDFRVDVRRWQLERDHAVAVLDSTDWARVPVHLETEQTNALRTTIRRCDLNIAHFEAEIAAIGARLAREGV